MKKLWQQLKGKLQSIDKQNKETAEFNQWLLSLEKEYVSAGKKLFWWVDAPTFSSLPTYLKIKSADNATKQALVNVLLDNVERYSKINKNKSVWGEGDHTRFRSALSNELLSRILRSNIGLMEADYMRIYSQFLDLDHKKLQSFDSFPVGFLTQQLERYAKREKFSADFIQFIEQLHQNELLGHERYYVGSDLQKVKLRLERILHLQKESDNEYTPVRLLKDQFGNFINELSTRQKSEEEEKRLRLE